MPDNEISDVVITDTRSWGAEKRNAGVTANACVAKEEDGRKELWFSLLNTKSGRNWLNIVLNDGVVISQDEVSGSTVK
jgi:hypothetical protein